MTTMTLLMPFRAVEMNVDSEVDTNVTQGANHENQGILFLRIQMINCYDFCYDCFYASFVMATRVDWFCGGYQVCQEA